MELKKIHISNYKSIESLTFELELIDGSKTFTLLGINESGKSSFLNALSLFDQGSLNYPLDFFDENNDVEVSLYYILNLNEIKELKEQLHNEHEFDKKLLEKIEIEEIIIKVSFEASEHTIKTVEEIIKFKQTLFTDYKEVNKKPQKKEKNDESKDILDLSDYCSRYLRDYFWNISHRIVFWKSSPEYLILEKIDLIEFATDPRKVSIPLKNCFDLAGLNDINKQITKLKSDVSIQNLEERLSHRVTSHINKVWPEHQIKVKFKINDLKLTFLVEDKGVRFQNKTPNQRSDGFRQFISFLLTLSAENESEELSNTILLIDEPETHLHPSAQINLRKELIKISANENDNIVFFATHSNYMIDKDNIDRCYRVNKESNKRTKLERIQGAHSSYSEVNYYIFDIITNDYHNELYGYLEEVENAKLKSLPKIKKWKNEKYKRTDDVSLAEYIRHSIHHPENTSNPKFTEKELRESIKILRELKYNSK